ncbi:MAG: CsgG/HfaB family protein [candidate division KSB1 bacterium]|nr:CsgG/HfaB family protein [candidate division KSB1 bacterium]
MLLGSPKVRIIGIWLIGIGLISVNCAPYKMKAIRAQRDHRPDLAIRFSLQHLEHHPDDQVTLNLLDQAAKSYFATSQKKISHFENLNEWDTVVRLAEESYQTMLAVSRVVGTTFPGKEELNFLQSKREQSQFKRADEFYAAGLKYFQGGDYREALQSFQTCETLVKHFKDTDRLLVEVKQKLAEQQYREAKNLFSQGQLEAALQRFEAAAAYASDYLDVQWQIRQMKERLAITHRDAGKRSLEVGNYRAAYEAFKKALSYQADDIETAQLLNDVKEKLTVRLAVFPFAATNLEPKFGGLAAQQILSRALPQKSEFLLFLEREHLQKLLEEQALSQTGVVDEKTAVQVGRLSGVNTIVVGNITRIGHQLTTPKAYNRVGHYRKKYRDAKGIERTVDETFNYTEYEVERWVELNLNYRIVSVETGVILHNESLSQRSSDRAQWINCPSEFISKLSGAEQRKLKATRQPVNEELLTEQALNELAEKAAAKIINQVLPLNN